MRDFDRRWRGSRKPAVLLSSLAAVVLMLMGATLLWPEDAVSPPVVLEETGDTLAASADASPLAEPVLSETDGSSSSAPTRAEDLEPEPRAWRLRGRVIDELTKSPVTRFVIEWSSPFDAATKMAGRLPVRDEAGAFELTLPSVGPWQLRFDGGPELEVGVIESVALPRSEPLLVALTPATAIEGIVRDEGGSAVAGVQVSLRVERLEPGSPLPKWTLVATDTGGRFQFTRVPAGSYSLRLAYHETELARVEPFEVSPGTRVRRDVSVATSRSLRVLVRNARDEPIRRARVSLRFEGEEIAARSGRTNEEGLLTLGYLPEDRATLRIAAGGYRVHEEPIELGLARGQHQMECRLFEDHP